MLIRSIRGFTLVELLITVTILGVLLALGVPEFNNFMGNTRLRSAAESFSTSLQVAKSAAASRNRPVELVLTNTPDPASLAVAVGVAPAAGWMVRAADRSVFIEGKNLIEGGRGGVATVSVNSAVTSVTFTALGGTTLANAATFAFTNPAAGTCANALPPGPMRCLNVIVSTTGRIKLCDPAVAAPDNRACQ